MLGERPRSRRGATPTLDPIGWAAGSRTESDPRAACQGLRTCGQPAGAADRSVPPVDLTAAGAPLPLHSQLQHLRARGHRPPWRPARQLADPEAAAALPPLDTLRLRSGA